MPSALILAGSRGGGDPFPASQGVAHKALIEVEGRPMLARVHAALTATGIDRIAIATDTAEVTALAKELGAEVIAADSGPSGSVARAFSLLGAPMIVTTSDHALLRPEWVRQFIADTPGNADVAVLLATRSEVERAVPGTRRTWLHFADGDWSGCNLFHLQTPEASAAIETWRMVETDRKRPWRIAARLGFSTLWSYWRGKLTLSEAVARLGRRIGITAAVVSAADGTAAVDVDKPQDLEEVKRILSR